MLAGYGAARHYRFGCVGDFAKGRRRRPEHQLFVGGGGVISCFAVLRPGNGAMSSDSVMAGLDPAIHLLRKELLRETMDPRVKPAGDERTCPSTQQIARRIERNERDAFLCEIFLGALQPIDEGDDLAHARAAV